MKIYAQLYITISQRNYFPNEFLISRKESNKNITKIFIAIDFLFGLKKPITK